MEGEFYLRSASRIPNFRRLCCPTERSRFEVQTNEHQFYMERSSLRDQIEEEQLDLEEQMEAFPEAQPITYFGTDFDVHGLVRRLNQGDIAIPSFDPGGEELDLEGFQRGFVWRRFQQDRFIESLLLGYPVPGIFLVQQKDKKLLVLDGQQRLRTLQAFYGEPEKPGFALESVATVFRGKQYNTLEDDERRTLDNTFIHGTIVKYDPRQGGDDAVYQVFERLNTGGANLTPHEIRVALYNGGFVRLLRDMNSDDNWRALYGPPSPRLKDQELILRFAALWLNAENYQRPLKKFLNDFVRDHRDCEGIDIDELRTVFQNVCVFLFNTIGRRAFRATGQVNAALVDAVMYGVAKRLGAGPVEEPQVVEEAYNRLIANGDFLSAIGRATADEDRVERRLRLATETFAQIP